MKARPYQNTAASKVFEAWGRGIQKTMVVMPTGTGKTILFAKICEKVVEQGGRPLVLAHRDELIRQAVDKIAKATGMTCAVEKAGEKAHDSLFPVVVGSVQSLSRPDRLARYSNAHFTHIVTDECHHAVSPQYLAIYDYFAGAKLLGVTATADRADKKNLGTVFDSLAYEYTIIEAIREGFLAPIRAQTIPLQIDLSRVRKQDGDFRAEDLGDALLPYLDEIAGHVEMHCRSRKTIIFVPLIATAVRFADILKARGLNAEHISGADEYRNEKREWYASQRAGAIMVNSMLWTEGFDDPSTDCIIVLRPTQSRPLYAQMVGRGTRICEGKNDLLLLDFLWLCDRHQLCRPASLIAETPEEVAEMSEIQEAAGGDGLLIDEDALQQAKESSTRKREEALAKRLEEQRKKKAKLVDPLQWSVSISAPELIDYDPAFAAERSPVTKEQAEFLERKGIDPSGVELAGHAEAIINMLVNRAQGGFATPKQIRALERVGIKHAGEYKFEHASDLISRIAANSWRPPGDLIRQENEQHEKRRKD